MSTLFLAMMLTGAGGLAEAQGGASGKPLPAPMVIVPVPPPLPYVPVPAPAPPPPPAPPRFTIPARLIRAPQTCYPFEEEGGYDFSDCFNGGDYPLPAWEARQQGVVGVRVSIGADGRPTACEVAVSSGSVALNRATCDLLRQRILGADDREGRRVTGAVIAGTVSWALPDGPPRDTRPDLLTYFSMDDYPASALRNEEQGTVIARVDVDATGRVSACTVTSSSGSAALDAATCRIMRVRVRFRPAMEPTGRPAPSATSISVTWQLPPD